MTIEIDRETFSVGFMAKGSVAMSTARCDFETNVFVIKKKSNYFNAEIEYKNHRHKVYIGIICV